VTKLVIIGYGQMGKLLDAMAEQQGFNVVARIDPALGTKLSRQEVKDGETAIEFTEPGAAFENIKKCLELDLPVVCGTTGWHHNLYELQKLVDYKQGAVVYGSNFSPGMNIFYELVRNTAKIMSAFDSYDAYGYELHHRYKKDSPSGTAKELAKILAEESSGNKKVVFADLQRRKADDEIHFASVRAGEIPGEHRIGFDSVYDTIELRHTARSRKGLAAGAFMAAHWLCGRKGLFSFNDIIKDQISR
jgi:4-hydroxy-tetrahydrodipicolinate reductase